MTYQLFHSYQFTETECRRMDLDGHLVYPGLLTKDVQRHLTEALAHIHSLESVAGHEPNRFAAEYNAYLEDLITHPQMLELVNQVLGKEIRYDHCVTLNRLGGNGGSHWHSHGYAEDDPRLGFIRIFFYVNGFEINDGGLTVVPGSHLFRDKKIHAKSDAELEAGWMMGKQHPITGQSLKIEHLSVPAGTVILMWTHAAHGVSARQSDSDTRWTVVYAYRNPGKPSGARWISQKYESQKRSAPNSSLKDLISLY
jgi:hypothetical protein